MKELFSELADRILKFNGISILHPALVQDFLLREVQPAQLRVTEFSPEINQFNLNVPVSERIELDAAEPISFALNWKLPAQYLSLNVEQHVLDAFSSRLPELGYDATQTEAAIARVARELDEYQTRGLQDLLRVIIFVLARFQENNQVFGVGRGSSCASFVLFLLGLHVVDSIKYDVPLEEFFHD